MTDPRLAELGKLLAAIDRDLSREFPPADAAAAAGAIAREALAAAEKVKLP